LPYFNPTRIYMKMKKLGLTGNLFNLYKIKEKKRTKYNKSYMIKI
jgi:hypothetical protein